MVHRTIAPFRDDVQSLGSGSVIYFKIIHEFSGACSYFVNDLNFVFLERN
jgi:hypothetical protein